MEVITGIISRVLSDPDENGSVFLRAEQETNNELMPIKVSGKSFTLKAGDAFRAEGVFKIYNNNDKVFRASMLRTELPITEKGVKRWLKGIFNPAKHGISSDNIDRLISARGVDIVQKAILDPSIILSLTSDVFKYRSSILEEWTARTSVRRAVTVMEESGLEALLIEKILRAFPDDAYNIIKKNPYKTAPINDIGFFNADLIGTHMGIDPSASERILAACIDILKKNESEGSTAMGFREFILSLAKTTKLSGEMLQDFILNLAKEDSSDTDFKLFKTTATDETASAIGIIRKFFYVSESKITRGISNLLLNSSLPSEKMVSDEAHKMIEQNPAFKRFDNVQRLAVIMATLEPFSILTGGPGTGKSTVMEAVAKLHSKIYKGPLYLTAPTGKASKRLAETTGRETSTLQSLLGQQPGSNGNPNTYEYNKGNPLPLYCTVAVDEASMLDVETMSALIEAIPYNGRIVLIGDKNQLPSVGAGDVLSNLLQTRLGERLIVPSTGLVKVYRQGADSGIALGAELINNGQVPEINSNGENGVSFKELEDCDIMSNVNELVGGLVETGLNPYKDISIIIPQAPGKYGTNAFNRMLSDRFNAGGVMINGVFPTTLEKNKGIPIPRVGDRIMVSATERVKNLSGEEIKITNGDLGFITKSENENGKTYIYIKTDENKEYRIMASSWRNIPLAYAGNVHKSQGSQYKHVIMIFAEEHVRMMERTLIYTGWTRAQSNLSCFGSQDVFADGIRNWNGNSRMTITPAFINSLGKESFFKADSIDWEARQLSMTIPKSSVPAFPVRPIERPTGRKIPSFMSQRYNKARPLPSFQKVRPSDKLGPMGETLMFYTVRINEEDYDGPNDEP